MDICVTRMWTANGGRPAKAPLLRQRSGPHTTYHEGQPLDAKLIGRSGLQDTQNRLLHADRSVMA